MRAFHWFFSALLFPCVVLPSSVAADQPATGVAEEVRQVVNLESLIQEAFQNSPGLQEKKRAYEAVRARAITAWLPNDPEIGVDVEGQSGLFRFDRTDNEYSVMQTIPFPAKLWLRGRLAFQEAEMAFQRYQEEKRDIVWHLEQPYYKLSLTKKTLAALEEIRALLDKFSKAVQARYESNQASQHDLLKVHIELSKLAIEIFNWKEQEHLSEAHFSHLLNQPLETLYRITEEPRSSPLSLSRSDLERTALQVRPELRVLEIGIKRAKTSRSLAVTEWLPDLTGRIEARQFSGQGSIREHDTFVGVTVPVWSLIKGLGGGWQGANREVQAAEALYTEMKNEVLLKIHEACSKVQAAENALSLYEQAILPQAKQQVEVALASYEAGRTDFLSLIDTQRTLKEAQIAYEKVRADHELGMADLRFAVGSALGKGDWYDVH